MIHVILPTHLRTLANISGEVMLEVGAPVTQTAILDALEQRYPALAGTIRDHGSAHRRTLLRFFGCGLDLSHAAPDAPVPAEVATGAEPFWIVGAVAGGESKGQASTDPMSAQRSDLPGIVGWFASALLR